MAVVDNAAGITITVTGQHNNNKLLDGLPAASANGQAVRFEQAVLTDGSHAFTAVQSGVDATAAANLATRNNVDASQVVIQAVTTAALPAYTITSGSVAAGTAVFTANANGAFPTLDANATVTASATEAVSSRFLLTQGASNLDNCVLTLTQQGSAGTPWIASMYSGLNTSTKLLGSKLRVIAGEQCAGAEYTHMYEGSFTLGTNPYYPVRVDARMGMNEGWTWNDPCLSQVMSATVPTDGYVSMSTAAAGFTCTQLNPTDRAGEYTVNCGTSASAIIVFRGPGVPITGTTAIDVGGEFSIPVLSTAAQEFIFNAGVFASVAGGVIVNGFAFVYDRLNKGVNLWAKTVSAGTSTGTFTDTGITVTAGRRYRWRLIRRAGDSAARFYVGSSADAFALVATHSANHPSGVGMASIPASTYKVAGTTSVNTMTLSDTHGTIQFPTRLAA